MIMMLLLRKLFIYLIDVLYIAFVVIVMFVHRTHGE